MSVKTISKDELRRMEGSEGLILQGCGGNLDEWVDGINDMLTEDGILLNGTRFHDCSTFEHDGSTCLLFPFKDDVELDVGKLAMWRLQTHGNFGGTWLSDYVPNKLGGFISKEQTAEAVQKRENAKSRLDEIFTIIEALANHPISYDDQIVRQILESVIVESKEKIKVVFVGGLEVTQTI